MTFPNVTVNKKPYVTVTINFMATYSSLNRNELYTTSGKTDGRVDFKSTALYVEKIIRKQVKSKH